MFPRALEYQQQALIIQKAFFGQNHQEVVKTSATIAFIYEQLGDDTNSEKWMQIAMTAQATLGTKPSLPNYSFLQVILIQSSQPLFKDYKACRKSQAWIPCEHKLPSYTF